ncbi:MAG: metallophosphoesterase, partial [Planctomycetota bacterium]
VPEWKLDFSSQSKNQGFFFLSLKANTTQTISTHFQYPEEKNSKILIGGDAEEGYFSLLKLRTKAISENPLFLLIVGDVVDKGTKFRYKMHQDFFDTFPFPTFAVIGDGDLDKNSFHKELPLESLFSLYHQFYGPIPFVIHIREQWNILGINNLYMEPSDIENLPSLSENLSANKILVAHVPPFDPRENITEKKQLIHGAPFLDFLLQQHFIASFYGEIHSFISVPLENHQIIITGGLGKKLPDLSDYHFVNVFLEEDTLKFEPVFSPLNTLEEWLNKQAFWWWSWFYLCYWNSFWRLLEIILLLFCFIFLPILYKLKLMQFFKRKSLPNLLPELSLTLPLV